MDRTALPSRTRCACLNQPAQKPRTRFATRDVCAPAPRPPHARFLRTALRPRPLSVLVPNRSGDHRVSVLAGVESRYDKILLIAGGIGITPCLGTFKGLHHFAQRGLCDCQEVRVVWAARFPNVFEIAREAIEEAEDDPRYIMNLFCDGWSSPSHVALLACRKGQPGMNAV